MTLVISKGLTLDNGTRAAAIAGVSPTLDYRFAREKREIETVSLTDKLTYTGGNGTFVGSDGFIQRATTNVPRFDHDPLSRQSLGLLSEVERTNLLPRSEEFDQSPWAVFFGATIATNQAIAPNGTKTAELLTLSSSNRFTGVRQVITLLPSTTYTLSWWVRSVTGTAPFCLKIFDGVADTFSPNLTATNSWQRFSLTVTTAAGAGGGNLQIANIASPLQTQELYIWGAQLEAASTPSTDIPTTSAAVTRAADSAVIDGTGVITGTYTMVEKPAGCAVVSGSNINLEPGFTAERVMVFPAALDAGQITAIRGAM
jgi:hypothetical protein